MLRLQSDIGRQGKVLAVAAAAILVVGGYVAWTYHGAAGAQSSLAQVQTGHGTPTPESEHYGEVLGRYNRRKAEEAERGNSSYLSVLSSRARPAPEASAGAGAATADASATTTAAVPPAAQLPQPSAATSASASSANNPAIRLAAGARPAAFDAKAAERLADQVQALVASWSTISHADARSSEGRSAIPTAALPGKSTASATGAASPSRLRLMEDLEPIPAVLDTEIDTDETSMVFAHAATGPYAGAVFVALGFKRSNDTVDMTFTQMKWHGKSYRIEAKAIDPDSMRSALSGEVSHHYLSRILVPSLALGLGRAGQLYEKANTETTVSPYGVIQSSTGSPTAQIVAGTVVGGMAQQAGQVLVQDAGQLPPKQVLVRRNSPIGIVLLAPVFADAEIGASASSSAEAHPAAPAASATAAPDGPGAATRPHP